MTLSNSVLATVAETHSAICQLDMLLASASAVQRVNTDLPRGKIEALEAGTLQVLSEVYGPSSSMYSHNLDCLQRIRQKREVTYIQTDMSLENSLKWLRESIPEFISALENRKSALLNEERMDIGKQTYALSELNKLLADIELVATRNTVDKIELNGEISAWDLTAKKVFTEIGLKEACEALSDLIDNVRAKIDATEIRSALRVDLMKAWIAKAEQFGALYFPKPPVKEQTFTPLVRIKQICGRFDSPARELRNRHDNRSPFSINDEYDVQDLLKAFLKIHFENVTEEDPVKKKAGGSSQIDFILSDVKIGIEVKITSIKNTEKVIRDQLNKDVVQYQGHPDCKTLVCFIYDPASQIRSPRQFERELNEFRADQLQVETIVVQSGHSNIPASF